MQRTVLKSKISYAVLTDANLYYEGSIGIDSELMEKANIIANEQVQVVNVNNGERLITYAIPMEYGSRQIVLNGPAARKGLSGDEVVIISYASIVDGDSFSPIVIDLKHDR